MGKGKKRKWPSSGSAAQPADGAPKDSAHKWRSSGSAEQPADGAPEGSAEQPARSATLHALLDTDVAPDPSSARLSANL